MNQEHVQELQDVVIRFSGDSGDGMQLTGTLFSDTSALMGNGISTFPDYPAEIRAPQGTVAGVSGFQVHFGARRVTNPGDYCDVLVAMNPAALKANRRWLKAGATVIIDGEKGFVTIDGENKFKDVEGMMEFPFLKTGEAKSHHLIFSDKNAIVTIEYNPMWL